MCRCTAFRSPRRARQADACYMSHLSTSSCDRCLKSVYSGEHTRASAWRDPAVYESRLPRDPYLLFPYMVLKRTDDCNWLDITADLTQNTRNDFTKFMHISRGHLILLTRLCNVVNYRGKSSYPDKTMSRQCLTVMNFSRGFDWFVLNRSSYRYLQNDFEEEKNWERHPSHNGSTMIQVDSRRSGEVAICWPQCRNYQRGGFLMLSYWKLRCCFSTVHVNLLSCCPLTPFIDKSDFKYQSRSQSSLQEWLMR